MQTKPIWNYENQDEIKVWDAGETQKWQNTIITTWNHKKNPSKRISLNGGSAGRGGGVTGVDKHLLSWNWVIPIQNALISSLLFPPLHADSGPWNRPRPRSTTAWILERTINVIVSHNLAHEGGYNYRAAFSRIYMQMTVPLLICYFCTNPADE